MKKLTEKYKKRIMSHYFSDEELKDSLKISRKSALDWIEEANHFIFKARGPKAWKKDEKLMKKIGW